MQKREKRLGFNARRALIGSRPAQLRKHDDFPLPDAYEDVESLAELACATEDKN